MTYRARHAWVLLVAAAPAIAQESVWSQSPISGHWYGFPSTTSSWSDAEAISVALGGHLASFGAQPEIDWIQGALADYMFVNYWIGLNDAAVEGTFAWTSGEPVTFTNWGVEQPNDATGSDDAVEARPTDGWRWYDSYGPSSLSRKPLMETVGVPRYGWTLPARFPVSHGSKRMVTGFFDANATRDIAVSNQATQGQIDVLLGDGAGGFAPAITLAPAIYVTGLAAADFDGDGIDDLFVSSETAAWVYLSDGAGGFGLGPSIGLAPSSVTDLAAADFDGDGRVDIAVAKWLGVGGALTVALADASGGFRPPVTYPISAHGFFVVAGRIDGDASIDLLVTAPNYPFTMSVFLNDGSGTFAASTLAADENFYTRPALADFDGDGNTDLAIPANYLPGVSVAHGDGAGHFVYAPLLASAREVVSVVPLDVDGDGLVDLAAAGRDDDVIAIHKNRGGVLQPFETLPAGDAPVLVVADDFDGDGRPDLAAASQTLDAVFVLRKLSRDCNQNGTDDPRDLELGTSIDCNGNGEPDECDLALGAAFDCDANGAIDVCEIAIDPSLDLDGDLVLDRCESAGDAYCFGDGSGTACPCGAAQNGDPGHGCRNSSGTSGVLVANGNPSVALDSVTLHASDLPSSTPGLFFQGDLATNGGLGSVFGDGLRCASQSVVRLGIRSAAGGAMAFGHGVAGDPSISAAGLVPASGATRHYQLWYRDAQSFCTSATWNLTNGVRVVWTP